MKRILTETRHQQSEKLDEMSTVEILKLMNQEDAQISKVIETQLDKIRAVIDLTTQAYRKGHKVIYIGAGTSGRLGVLDAAELVPTFNADPQRYLGLIAGGHKAMTQAVEGAEDSGNQGQADLKALPLTSDDVVIGIAASGRTPYVIGALDYAQSIGCRTVALSCNSPAQMSQSAHIAIEVPVGPEVLTGSTRLKAGTAQKLILNMISTATMIKVGKVYGNLMVDVQATNQKLVQRSIGIIQTITELDEDASLRLYEQAGQNIKVAILMHLKNEPKTNAEALLEKHKGIVKDALNASTEE